MITDKWTLNMNKCLKKRKYKYTIANKHVRECLTLLENRREVHIKMDTIFYLSNCQRLRRRVPSLGQCVQKTEILIKLHSHCSCKCNLDCCSCGIIYQYIF